MSCHCGMHSYRARALDREWRVAYKRTGRRLMALFGVVLAAWITASWWAIIWTVEHVLPH